MKAKILYSVICSAALLYSGCKPRLEKDKDLPNPSAAEFASSTYLDPADPDFGNFLVFQNTTPGGFISSWDFAGTKKSTKFNDTAFFAFAGTYKVTLISASKGGASTVSKDIVVANTSPLAAAFDVEKIDPFRFKVSVTTVGGVAQKFMYGNGDTSSAKIDTVYFPFKGTYDITLAVTAKKGNSLFDSKLTKQVTVDQDDPVNPDLTDSVFALLTGGPNAVNGKTWILFNNNGVGPLTPAAFDGTTELAWFKNTSGIPGPEWVNGARANEFTFKLTQYQFIPKNTNATIHYAAANAFFGKQQAQYADIAIPDPNLKQAPFLLRKNPKLATPVKYSLVIANGSYFGYHENRYYYEIVKIKEDTLYIRQPYNDIVTEDPSKDGGARYFTYVKKR